MTGKGPTTGMTTTDYGLTKKLKEEGQILEVDQPDQTRPGKTENETDRPGVSVPQRQLHPGRMRNLVERTERGERGVHKEDQLDQ